MAEGSKVHIGDNSPEHVALVLCKLIGFAEGKTNGDGTPKAAGDRRYLLDTYAECLQAVTASCYSQQSPLPRGETPKE